MACTIKPEDIKRVKGLGFLNNKGTDLFNGRVITVNGKITAEQAKVIAEAAEKFGSGEMVFTTRLTVEVKGIHYDNIEPFREYVAKAGLETGGTGTKVRPIVSCKGTTCQYGLYDTYDLSEKIHERFYKGYREVKLPHKFKIATGGCPNNCVKPDLNDIGIVGQMVHAHNTELCKGCGKCQIELNCPMKAAKVVDGKIQVDESICNNCGRCIKFCPFHVNDEAVPGFKVYIGGRWGKKTAHGRALSKIFTSEDEVLNVVEKALLLFRDKGEPGERFADTISRIGFEEAEKLILSDELLARKAEILAD
ncbi:MAG: 4Fe-4S binding protein [Eubacterium sp.]|nr:4Fe-4S binding protein [Eubacterium sp.]